MPEFPSAKKLFGWISGKADTAPASVVARRFLSVFQEHGVALTQIPRLLPKFPLAALESEASLFRSLSPDVLDQVAKLFGVRCQWLEGVDDQIYEYLACYKRPKVILDHLAAICRRQGPDLDFPLRVLTTDKHLDRNASNRQLLVPVIVEPIAMIGEEQIYRYHLYRDGFDWEYEPTRIELKAIARLMFLNLSQPTALFVISQKEMDDVLDGKVIPMRYLDGCQLSSPSLEDYALEQERSHIAKEVDEFPEVLRYIQQEDLQDYSFGCFAPLSLVSEGDIATHKSAKEIATDVAFAPIPEVGSVDRLDDWRDRARVIADELDDRDTQAGAYDSVSSLADRVAYRMRELEIHGPRGPLSGPTILREALQGKKWKRKRKR
jgi:hypothetical protein